METNAELELAYQFISQTDRHLFLTGKAGTGKTTFLHRVRESIAKRKVVVAPTGVAAINAKGVTIHSLFQLPFGVLSPDRLKGELRKHRLSNKKADVLRRLDLLVIDEISMVRVDVLDALGAVLRKYRQNDRPFGGVQLLMIGDLHQLPPVVRDGDWNQLRDHYATPFFFDSHELKRAGARTVQLTHIYRQSDSDFIELLNKVRNDRLAAADLTELNTRYRGPDFSPGSEEDYITLTSHNAQARRINDGRLADIPHKAETFTAETTGSFPESMYPNEAELTFKVGAQVMFNKNDTSEQRYYNGKIGRIVNMEAGCITVACPGEPAIEVIPVVWENRRYEVDKKSNAVTDEVVGTYTQHPLRLAWAITIHKSQGMTFERVIIDAADAFAHGQVYVALSRCKTFEGIVLRSRIADRSVKTDRVVSDYSEQAAASVPTAADLYEDRRGYQLNCLSQLFDFGRVTQQVSYLVQQVQDHDRSLQGNLLADIEALRERIRKEIARVGAGFRRRLPDYGKDERLPIAHDALCTRLIAAAEYFMPLLAREYDYLGTLPMLSDNRAVKESITERIDDIRLLLLSKEYAFRTLQEGYDPDRYLHSRTEAERAFNRVETMNVTKKATTPSITRHPVLYTQLTEWRTMRAAEAGIPAYCVLHNTVLMSIAEQLPRSTPALMSIKGFGSKSRDAYATEVLTLVEAYRAEGLSG